VATVAAAEIESDAGAVGRVGVDEGLDFGPGVLPRGREVGRDPVVGVAHVGAAGALVVVAMSSIAFPILVPGHRRVSSTNPQKCS